MESCRCCGACSRAVCSIISITGARPGRPGNNGGDGMVIARYLHGRGIATRLHLCAERSRLRGDALLHFHAARGGVPVGTAPMKSR